MRRKLILDSSPGVANVRARGLARGNRLGAGVAPIRLHYYYQGGHRDQQIRGCIGQSSAAPATFATHRRPPWFEADASLSSTAAALGRTPV